MEATRTMKRASFFLAAIVLIVLSACAPSAVRRVHQLHVYGDGFNESVTHVYGTLGKFNLGGENVELSDYDVADVRLAQPYAVADARLIDGEVVQRTPLDPYEDNAFAVQRIPLSTDLQVLYTDGVKELVYFDGSAFLNLPVDGPPNTVRRVSPRPRLNGLSGFGQLTSREAAAFEKVLGDEPYLIARIEPPFTPKQIGGVEEQRETFVLVERGLETDMGAYRAPPEQLLWEQLAAGSRASGFATPSFRLVRSADELDRLWTRFYGSQLTMPDTPRLNYERETVIAIMLGDKPTGGYGLEVVRVFEERGELYVDVRVTEPGEGAFVTQALTSPWELITVLRGDYRVAWIRDTDTGALIGVAQ